MAGKYKSGSKWLVAVFLLQAFLLLFRNEIKAQTLIQDTLHTITIYSDRNYRVTLSPANPRAKDTLVITAINRSSIFMKEKGYTEYKLVEHKKATYSNRRELQISISHDCGAEATAKEIPYQVKIPPLRQSGYYLITFKNGFLYPDEPHTDQEHCFEAIPASVWIEIK
jgi:hypothetical protein